LDESQRSCVDVLRMQTGDDRAFAALIERSGLPLKAFLRRTAPVVTRTDYDLDDLFQAVVFRAWQIRAAFVDQGPGSFYRWLVALARNIIGDRLRHLHAGMRDAPGPSLTPSAVASEVPASITSASSRAGRVEDVGRLTEMLDLMPEKRRRIVEMHHLEGATVRDIADKLEMSKSTVFDELKNAMESMKEFFGAGAA
jgi:RNA polymerase sigma factor (sigma-70 family)